MNIIDAVSIRGQTMICPDREFPHKRGNCFSVAGADGKNYRIVNFVAENLEYLNANGVPFPVQIAVLCDQVAVIHDKRIPSEWYSNHFCEVCCPQRLLPEPQKLRIQREIMQGVRIERGNMVEIVFGMAPKIAMPTKS